MTMEEAFRAAIVAPNRMPVADWCAENVRLPYGSARAPTFSPDLTPWVREPMEEIFDNANSEIVIRAPVGSGKSTTIESVLDYIVAEDPGPTLITGQTDDDIEAWAETRAWPVLKESPATAGLMPHQRGKTRKRDIIFPHMPVHLTGANMSGLQSKSIRWLLGDEAWMWKPGLIEEFRNRMHRRWNGRRVLMGQAGVEGDDFDLAFQQSEQRTWSYQCRKCKTVTPFSFQQLKIPAEGTNAERAARCNYTCTCGHVYHDTTKDRRAMSDSARYIVTKPAEMPGHIAFHFNVLTLWESDWRKVAAEWLNAHDALRQGNTRPLMQFLQKQLAEPWKEELGINRPDLPRLDERVEDYADGKRIDGEVKRFATIDVQRDHYWVAIRAWRTDGSSVGLWYGRVNTEEVCAELVSRYQIEPQHVYVDTGYDSGRVYDIICRFGWCGIRGDGQQRAFRHKSRRGHQEKLYSPIKHALAPCGSRARYFFIAVEPIKDILAKLRGGDGAKWEILEGLPREYEEQLDSEVKEEFLAPKTNQSQHRWVKKRKANHAWDCEVYQVAAALVWGLFGE